MKPIQILRLVGHLKEVSKNKAELSMPMIQILCLVAENPNITISEVRDHLGIAYSSITNYVQKLGEGENSRKRNGVNFAKQGLGLIRWEISKEDYRQRQLSLTDEGKAFFENLENI